MGACHFDTRVISTRAQRRGRPPPAEPRTPSGARTRGLVITPIERHGLGALCDARSCVAGSLQDARTPARAFPRHRAKGEYPSRGARTPSNSTDLPHTHGKCPPAFPDGLPSPPTPTHLPRPRAAPVGLGCPAGVPGDVYLKGGAARRACARVGAPREGVAPLGPPFPPPPPTPPTYLPTPDQAIRLQPTCEVAS